MKKVTLVLTVFLSTVLLTNCTDATNKYEELKNAEREVLQTEKKAHIDKDEIVNPRDKGK